MKLMGQGSALKILIYCLDYQAGRGLRLFEACVICVMKTAVGYQNLYVETRAIACNKGSDQTAHQCRLIGGLCMHKAGFLITEFILSYDVTIIQCHK